MVQHRSEAAAPGSAQMSQWVFLQGFSEVWQPMLGYFTCTRNSVPSAHMHSLYLSKPSSKYTSPAELGMRVALNMTEPLRTMLFSCGETRETPVSGAPLASVCPRPRPCTKAPVQGWVGGQIPGLTALSSMSPPILNSTVRPMTLTPSFPRTMALPSPLMFRSVAALLVIYGGRKTPVQERVPHRPGCGGRVTRQTTAHAPSPWTPFSR